MIIIFGPPGGDLPKIFTQGCTLMKTIGKLLHLLKKGFSPHPVCYYYSII